MSTNEKINQEISEDELDQVSGGNAANTIGAGTFVDDAVKAAKAAIDQLKKNLPGIDRF